MESDWLTHFRANNPQGRPEGHGWTTAQEMADEAGVDIQSVRRYLKTNKSKFESKIGTVTLDIGTRRVTYFKYKTNTSK